MFTAKPWLPIKTRLAINTPWAALNKRPLSVGTMVLLGLTMIWFGVVLLGLPEPGPSEHGVYGGPLEFFPFDVWGAMFLASGFVQAIRIVILDYPIVSLLLHLPVLAVNVGFALSFDFGGPMTLAQPLITCFAFLVGVSPFLTSITLYFTARNGFKLVPDYSKYSVEDYYLFHGRREGEAPPQAG